MSFSTNHLTQRRYMVGLLVFIVACWVVITPPGAGPDEPTHLVRSAGLIRGDITGSPSDRPDGARNFVVPSWLGEADPRCYAFSAEPASCRPRNVGDDSPQTRPSDAGYYPIWGHLLPGLGTFATTATVGIPLSRLLSALLPIILIAWALAIGRRKGILTTSAICLAMTPMVWSTLSQVQPSSLVIAGGIALFVASLDLNAAASRWLFVAAFAALILPRRDGMIWAATALAILVVYNDWTTKQFIKIFSTAQQATLAVAAALAVGWAVFAPGPLPILIALAPLLYIAVVAGRRFLTISPLPVLGSITAIVVPLAVLTWIVVSLRPGAITAQAVANTISKTGEHLGQAIGVLGWVDTPIPTTMLFLWLIAFGVLIGHHVSHGRWLELAICTTIVATTTALSWMIELVQGGSGGNYWQGRYSLPLLVGAPILLCARAETTQQATRVGRVILVAMFVVANGAIIGATRRWAGGLNGTMVPWHWNTYGTLVDPVVVLVVHFAATAVLYQSLANAPDEPACPPQSDVEQAVV